MKPLIRESLIILNTVGLHPTNQNVWSKVRLAITFIIMLAVDTEYLLEVIFHWNGLESIPNLAYFIGYYQVCIRAFALFVNRRKFARVLNMLENFWTPNEYRSNKNIGGVETDAQATYRIARKTMKIIFILYNIITIVYCVVLPLRRKVLFTMYHYTASTKSPDYELGMLISFIGIAFAAFVLSGFDSVYAAMIIHVIYELKIIKQRLRMLPINLKVNGDEEHCLKELASLIDQHNYVLRFIKEMNQIYSIALLNQFLTSVVSFAAILVAVTTTSSATVNFYGMYICAFMGQLYCFCLGGSFLTTECESVSDADYACQWWSKTQPKLRNAIVLIIQRAQKLEMLSAGGFFPVNLPSFTRVVNTAGSFFSVMLAAYRNKDKN